MLKNCLGLPAAAACLIASPALAQAAPSDLAAEAAPASASPIVAAEAEPDTELPSAILPAGAVVMVSTNEELSTATAKYGDRFTVTVIEDVVDPATGAVVIPLGTSGYGEVTFVSRKGGFGKQGILAITLRYLDLDGRPVLLDGRYRQEGKSNDGAAAVTMFAVGVFAFAVKGKTATIPQGRPLKARTGEDIAITPQAARATPTPVEAAAAPAAAEPIAEIAPANGQPSASQPN